MCGRYQLVLPAEMMAKLFALEELPTSYPPRYNIAPTQPVHVVRFGARGGRRAELMRWGLMPTWVKDPARFPLLINARAETAATKPAFRNALRRRRALLPATGFYEWSREAGRKVPHLFEPDGSEAFALAGVWETWCGPNGEEVDTVAILTAEAEGVPASFHERMPLSVPERAYADWLDPRLDDGEEALALTERGTYSARPVSRRLNSAENEGAGLLEPDEEPVAAPQDATVGEQPRLL